jgi:hypothetical protein
MHAYRQFGGVVTDHLLRARLIAWRRAELDVTGLVEDARRGLPGQVACDALRDRLDRIDAQLRAIRSLTEEIECEL